MAERAMVWACAGRSARVITDEVSHRTTELAAWLAGRGPLPLVALVAHDGRPPAWTLRFDPRVVHPTRPLVACLLLTTAHIDAFVEAGEAHDRTTLVWPRRGVAKLFEALALSRGTDSWADAADTRLELGQALRAATSSLGTENATAVISKHSRTAESAPASISRTRAARPAGV